ncbi:MAG: elongation factor G [Planctomycetota bacterium]
MADSNDPTLLRNIGIIAHIDAGKTTVTERMLYLSGAKHRVGRVDHGTTDTDDDPEEQQRGITIFSACVKFAWQQYNINLLDTPGHVDFTAEVERCLRVLDGAVVVFSAREGVEAQSETVWRQADRYSVPRIVFINKMDREGASFETVFQDIGPRLGGRPVAVELPVGEGPAHVDNPFRGVIDLVDMKFLQFDPETEGKEVSESELPAELVDDAAIWREQMLEVVYELDEEALALAMEDKEIPRDLVVAALRKGCVAGQIQPVFCGSALHGIGVQPLMTGVGNYLPSPIDRPPVEGKDLKKPDKMLKREPSEKDPFCGLVFKILPAKTGDNYWVRIYSGQLKQNSRVVCPNRDNKKENVAQIWQIHATKKDRDGQIDTVGAGDICCVIGPRFAITGDTLCDSKQPIELPSIAFAETVLSMAIEPESTGDRKKLEEALEMLRRQDPTFRAVENEELGQTIISGMGELHLEVIQHRLTRDFGLNVKFYKPRVNYRETIGAASDVVGQCNRVVGATQMFARLKLRFEPTKDPSDPVIVFDRLPPDCLPNDVRSAAIEELRARAEGGGLIAGFPLSGVRIDALDVETQEEGSDEVAFRIAAGDGFDEGLRGSGPVLLEPVMKVEVTTPEEYMGEIVGDLLQRRASIASTETRGAMSVITADAPLKEMFGYSSAVRSLSQGRAGSSMEPLGYQPAPKEDVDSFQS